MGRTKGGVLGFKRKSCGRAVHQGHPVRCGRVLLRTDGDVRCRSDCQLAFVTLD